MPSDWRPSTVFRTGPALGGLQDDHRPAGALGPAFDPRCSLDGRDRFDRLVEHFGHLLVDVVRLVPLDPEHRMAVSFEQRGELPATDAGEHRRGCDLVPVQVQDRKHGSVGERVEELVRVPARRQRARLRLPIAHDAADHQVGVVEGGAIGVREGVSQLAPFVDGAGCLRGHVRGDTAWERELAEEAAHAGFVLGHLRIDLGVRAFQVGIGDGGRPPVPRPDHVDRVQVPVPDHPVHVRVDEVEARGGPPVPEQPRLDVLRAKRLAQQGIVHQVDLADGQVVGCPPVPIDESQLFCAQCAAHVPVLLVDSTETSTVVQRPWGAPPHSHTRANGIRSGPLRFSMLSRAWPTRSAVRPVRDRRSRYRSRCAGARSTRGRVRRGRRRRGAARDRPRRRRIRRPRRPKGPARPPGAAAGRGGLPSAARRPRGGDPRGGSSWFLASVAEQTKAVADDQ